VRFLIIPNEINGEPRVRDEKIALRLEFERPRDIRKLIERNIEELQRFGTCATVARVVRRNPVTEYWLNEEQALLIASLSNTDRAADVHAMLIRSFVCFRRHKAGHQDLAMGDAARGRSGAGYSPKRLRWGAR
jgi:anti-repressor protein